MNRPMTGRLILIAGDEPLNVLQLTLALEDEGALVIRARTVNEALTAVEDHRLSAAVLDCGLSAGDTSAICERMSERNIPFISYSHEPHNGAMPGDPDVKKPIAMPELIAIVKRAIAEHLPESGVQYRPTAGASRQILHLF
jgi:CheY-like chemotaxis protein